MKQCGMTRDYNLAYHLWLWPRRSSGTCRDTRADFEAQEGSSGHL